MKVIIAGSRHITDISALIAGINQSGFNITEVVCGCARGVDTLGENWADENNVPVKSFSPNWYDNEGNYDRTAGNKRNEVMGRYADALIAIWDGISPGTLHMIKFMKQQNKPLYVFRTDLPNTYVNLFE